MGGRLISFKTVFHSNLGKRKFNIIRKTMDSIKRWLMDQLGILFIWLLFSIERKKLTTKLFCANFFLLWKCKQIVVIKWVPFYVQAHAPPQFIKFILIKKKQQLHFSIAYHNHRFAVFVVIISQLIQNSSLLFCWLLGGFEKRNQITRFGHICKWKWLRVTIIKWSLNKIHSFGFHFHDGSDFFISIGQRMFLPLDLTFTWLFDLICLYFISKELVCSRNLIFPFFSSFPFSLQVNLDMGNCSIQQCLVD